MADVKSAKKKASALKTQNARLQTDVAVANAATADTKNALTLSQTQASSLQRQVDALKRQLVLPPPPTSTETDDEKPTAPPLSSPTPSMDAKKFQVRAPSSHVGVSRDLILLAFIARARWQSR